MTFKRIFSTLLVAAAFAACGNYSNEDLEFMNAVPARQDLIAYIQPAMILPANEAELAKDTHAVISTFNGALDFLLAADAIRRYPPTSRIPDGRVWGPAKMDDHPGWQWRFTMTRDPAAAGKFDYMFDVQPIGGGDTWYPFIDGSFVATGGARRGVGMFRIQTDPLWAAGFPFANGADGSLLKELDIMYSTAAFPTSVTMHMVLYPNNAGGDHTTMSMIDYHYEAAESGEGGMEFVGTDSTGKSISVTSRWLASGRGRAEATYADPASGVTLTWTECWDDSFRSTYDDRPWDTTINSGDPANCPDIAPF